MRKTTSLLVIHIIIIMCSLHFGSFNETVIVALIGVLMWLSIITEVLITKNK